MKWPNITQLVRDKVRNMAITLVRIGLKYFLICKINGKKSWDTIYEHEKPCVAGRLCLQRCLPVYWVKPQPGLGVAFDCDQERILQQVGWVQVRNSLKREWQWMAAACRQQRARKQEEKRRSLNFLGIGQIPCQLLKPGHLVSGAGICVVWELGLYCPRIWGSHRALDGVGWCSETPPSPKAKKGAFQAGSEEQDLTAAVSFRSPRWQDLASPIQRSQ